MENTQETKVCKHCQTEIPKKAKVCPNCKKKQGGIVKWIVIAVIVIALIGSMGGGSDDESKTNNTNNAGITNTANNTNNEVETESEVEITYTPCTVDEMVTMLEENALKAEKTYQDQYIELTGKLSVIDSDGSYIALSSVDNTWSFTTVQCYIQNEEQLDKVIEMKQGDTVTLKGKVTDIGEVLGYQLDIDSIN